MLGTLGVDAVADTYVKTLGWGKGMLWVNGRHLGRYWEAQGPQHALYLPAPYLKQGATSLAPPSTAPSQRDCPSTLQSPPCFCSSNQGANELILLELDAPRADASLSFATAPDFSGKPPAACKGRCAPPRAAPVPATRTLSMAVPVAAGRRSTTRSRCSAATRR